MCLAVFARGARAQIFEDTLSRDTLADTVDYSARYLRALEQDEGEKLGGKSAEAARFILRAVDRELDNA